MAVFSIACADVLAPAPPSSHIVGCLITFVAVGLLDVALRLIFPDQKTRWFCPANHLSQMV